MAINYSILKSSIVNTSIWLEDSDTRIVWITMIALRNKDGEVYGSVAGLAHAAIVPVEKCRTVLAKFLAPDDDSASKENGGRRIAEIPGGWKLLSHERIKAEAAVASKNSYMKNYMKAARKHKKTMKSLPVEGEREYLVAMEEGKPQEELDAIVTKYLPATHET